MDRQPLKLGVAANLTAGESVHTDTFIRAVHMSDERLNSSGKDHIDICWANDRASAEGGFYAAGRLLEDGVRLVVGHYASSAARSALDVYSGVTLPVLLPAATADCLTMDFRNAFRLCPNERRLADFIAGYLLGVKGYRRVAVLHDHSLHGESLSGVLKSKMGEALGAMVPEAVVFIGSYSRSIAFLASFRREHADCPVYFADDAVSGNIAKDTEGDTNLFIFGNAPSVDYPAAAAINNLYRDRYGELPPTYFLETYAAMQIAMSVLPEGGSGEDLHRRIRAAVWQTVMGDVRFDERELPNSRLCLWHIAGGTELVPYYKN